MSAPLDVCAAVIIHDDRILLATRRPGGHLAGRWEFPGGKQHVNETLADCIARELREELDLQARGASLLFSIVHRYPEKTVRLWFMRCDLLTDASALRCLEGQKAGWFTANELKDLPLAPADHAVLAWLGGDDAATPERRVADADGTNELRQWLSRPAIPRTGESPS
jgi:8-oxo-dGTP diphosphatase